MNDLILEAPDDGTPVGCGVTLIAAASNPEVEITIACTDDPHSMQWIYLTYQQAVDLRDWLDTWLNLQ